MRGSLLVYPAGMGKAMAVKSYYEQLKDPRWQKVRLEMLERWEWTCSVCQSKEKTLHVHHTYYEKGMAPWDYPQHSLKVLCEECHAGAEDDLTEMHRALGRSHWFCHTDTLTGLMDGEIMWMDPDALVTLRNINHARGIDLIYGVTGFAVRDWADESGQISARTILERIGSGVHERCSTLFLARMFWWQTMQHEDNDPPKTDKE